VSAAAPSVLVVEDESSIASFVALYLKNAGYAVRTASTGGDALQQVASEEPSTGSRSASACASGPTSRS
jgi:CheY-like chemotaxis protein